MIRVWMILCAWIKGSMIWPVNYIAILNVFVLSWSSFLISWQSSLQHKHRYSASSDPWSYTDSSRCHNVSPIGKANIKIANKNYQQCLRNIWSYCSLFELPNHKIFRKANSDSGFNFKHVGVWLHFKSSFNRVAKHKQC